MTYESKHPGKPVPELQMNRLWSIEETAYFLGVSIDTVRTWRRLGRGPRGLRLGKHVKYRPQDVTAWLATREDALLPEGTKRRAGRAPRSDTGGTSELDNNDDNQRSRRSTYSPIASSTAAAPVSWIRRPK
jgi:Helix-turn-helix domain